MSSEIDTLRRQIRQLDALVADGALSEAAAKDSRAALEQRLVAAVMTMSGAEDAAPAATAPAGPVDVAALPAAALPPVTRLPRKLVGGLAVAVAAIAVGGYLWLGNVDGLKVSPGSPGAATAEAADEAASGAHPMEVKQIEGMVAKLAEKLKSQPDDPVGWLMLGRSYAVLGRYGDAIPAYRKVLALKPNDAQALADLADALAVQNNRGFDGEPAKLVQQALAAEPDNVKALALAGTIAFDKKDFPGAIKAWERAVAVGPADSDIVKQIKAGLQEARTLAGGGTVLGAAAAAEAVPAAASAAGKGAPAAAANANASVAGRVELGKAFAGKAGPDDTVFIYARAAGGSRMPLALLKKKVSDLPFEFELTDAQAMSPALALSSASKVIVTARVSKSGQAMPEPGDLTGSTAEVAVGARGVKIVIDEAVGTAR